MNVTNSTNYDIENVREIRRQPMVLRALESILAKALKIEQYADCEVAIGHGYMRLGSVKRNHAVMIFNDVYVIIHCYSTKERRDLEHCVAEKKFKLLIAEPTLIKTACGIVQDWLQ